MIIWAAFFGILTSEIIFYVFAILPINSATASALFVTTNIALTLRIVVIIGFIYHGTVFWLKRRICGMKTETLRVLDQVKI
ncbi:hypothetical protein BDF19DRAFT_235876 [Syncephalis fuscata]|nr:hypothetical protein BDF19DRAFT_235876 [Syncephalis fuscata]